MPFSVVNDSTNTNQFAFKEGYTLNHLVNKGEGTAGPMPYW